MFACLLMIKVLLPITEKEDCAVDPQDTINETDFNVAESGLYATVKVLLVEDDDEEMMLNQRIWLQLVDEKPEDRAELLEFSRRTRDRPHRQSVSGSTTMSS